MTQPRESRPTQDQAAQSISAGASTILPNETVNSAFKPLTDTEWAEANSVEARIEYARQVAYAQGWHDGAMFGKAECLTDHGTVANRIEAAARRFLAMDAQEAHEKATGVWR